MTTETNKGIMIIHSADLHYGYRQYGMPERETDMYDVGWEICRKAVELQADAVIFAGDIFDMQKPPAQAVKALNLQAAYLAYHKIPLLGVDGNHDTCNGDWLDVCGVHNLHEKGSKQFKLTDDREITIEGISYMRPAVFLAKLKDMAADGVKADILVIHQPVGEFADFFEGGLTAQEMTPYLREMGVKHVAMGDIHAYKETVIGGIRWVYPGSPEVMAIDESTDKTFSIIRVAPDGEFSTGVYPVPIRPVAEIQLDTDTDIDSAIKQLPEKVNGGKSPIVHIWYEKEVATIARQLEDTLRKDNALFRSHPIVRTEDGNLLKQMSGDSFDRSGAIGQLQSAVDSYFDPDTEQHELVFSCLGNPGGIRSIVGDYLKQKGMEIDGLTNI